MARRHAEEAAVCGNGATLDPFETWKGVTGPEEAGQLLRRHYRGKSVEDMANWLRCQGFPATVMPGAFQQPKGKQLKISAGLSRVRTVEAALAEVAAVADQLRTKLQYSSMPLDHVDTADEIKQLFLNFQAAGVPFHQVLRKEPWGARNFIVLDPDGNLILFAGPAD